MKVTTLLLTAGTILFSSSASYAQAGAQASSSASSSTSVEANKSGVQASNSTQTSASASAGQKSATLSSGTTLNAVLSQPVDAKKNKPGDQVTAKTTETVKSEGKVIIPRGSRLIGHLTECKPRNKEEKESALGIVFDKAILKGGQEIPLNITIQALAAAQSAVSSSYGGDDLSGGAMGSARSSGRGAIGGLGSTAGAATGAVANTAANVGGAAGGAANSTINAAGATNGAIGGLNAAGQLTSNSQGVFGLQGLNLSSSVSSNTQASVITSTSKNVHLDSATQLVLVAHASASADGSRQ